MGECFSSQTQGSRTVFETTVDSSKFQENGLYFNGKVDPIKRYLYESDFKKIKVLGEGGFSTVYLVQMNETKKFYALKKFNKKFVMKKKLLDYVKTERYLHGCFHHPFIIKLNYAFQSDENLYFVFSYLRGGDLKNLMKKIGSFTENQVRLYATELILALSYIHCHSIVHMDLKLENILLGKDGHIILNDFGFSQLVNRKYHHKVVGTPHYFPPEVIKLIKNKQDTSTFKPSKSIDYWALGCILYEMVYGENPFISKIEEGTYFNILNNEVMFPPTPVVSDEIKDLIEKLLIKDPEKRLGTNSFNELMQHPFFKGVNFHDAYKKRTKPEYIPEDFEIEVDDDIERKEQEINNSGYKEEKCQQRGFNNEKTESETIPVDMNLTKFNYYNSSPPSDGPFGKLYRRQMELGNNE